MWWENGWSCGGASTSAEKRAKTATPPPCSGFFVVEKPISPPTLKKGSISTEIEWFNARFSCQLIHRSVVDWITAAASWRVFYSTLWTRSTPKKNANWEIFLAPPGSTDILQLKMDILQKVGGWCIHSHQRKNTLHKIGFFLSEPIVTAFDHIGCAQWEP